MPSCLTLVPVLAAAPSRWREHPISALVPRGRPAWARGECPATALEWLQKFRERHQATVEEQQDHAAPLRYRPGSGLGLASQRIPRRVFQVAKNATAELRSHNRKWMSSWWRLNPGHEYLLLDDEDCADFIARYASVATQLAYARLAHGAQRSDLFRYVVLRELGGVYADTDAQLLEPLDSFVPANASMIFPLRGGVPVSADFMAYEAHHPFLDQAVEEVVQRVHNETNKVATGERKRCHGSHECVIRITGPIAYSMALVGSARRFCATGPTSGAFPTAEVCATAELEPVRAMHVCGFHGEAKLGFYCGAVQHWDCRNTDAKRDCGASHYSKADSFFLPEATVADALGPAFDEASECARNRLSATLVPSTRRVPAVRPE